MIHKTINSVVAVFGLILASVTAWHQFVPIPDSIILTTEMRYDWGHKISFKDAPFFETSLNPYNKIMGPVFWKVRIYNNLDRGVSIIGYDVFHIGEDGSTQYYSDMHERFAFFGGDPQKLHFPYNIDSRTGRAVLVGINIPIAAGDELMEICVEPNITLAEFERCFIEESDSDFFGNEVRVGYSDEKLGNFLFSIISASQISQPQFVLILETADGSRFSTELLYYPRQY